MCWDSKGLLLELLKKRLFADTVFTEEDNSNCRGVKGGANY